MPKRLVNPIDELERLQHRSTTMFVDHMLAIVRAGARGGDAAKQIQDLTDLIASSTGIADMLGRRRLLLEIDHHLGRKLQFADVETPLIPNVTFTEALADMVEREPRLARSAQEVRDLYNTPDGKFFSMAKVRANKAGMEILERVQEIVAKAIREGRETDTTIRAIERQAENFTRAYAQTVFRTNLTTAYTEGRFAQARDPDVSDFVPAFRYDAVGDAGTRPNHAAGEGFIAAVNDPIWNRYRPPNGYNCFHPSTIVSGPVLAALKMRYLGDMIEIETRKGNRLAVTVNHPVCTSTGWKSAERIEVGDNLLCYVGNGELIDQPKSFFPSPLSSRSGVDDQHPPSTIEDVFKTLGAEGVGSTGFRSRLPTLPLDLHGDAVNGDGYIDVVRADGKLQGSENSFPFEGLRDFDLEFADKMQSPGDGLRSLDLRDDACPSSLGSLPSIGTLTLDDLPVPIARSSLFPFEPFRLGPAAYANVHALEEPRQSGSSDPEFVRELLHAGSGLIAFDDVVRVRRFKFSGHVYDLQTETGWILSENIVTSNCRCMLEFVTVDELQRLKAIGPGGRVFRGQVRGGKFLRLRELPKGAFPDAGFR